jgi:hypothetical protein
VCRAEVATEVEGVPAELAALALDAYDPVLLAAMSVPELAAAVGSALGLAPESHRPPAQRRFRVEAPAAERIAPLKPLMPASGASRVLQALRDVGFDWGPAAALVAAPGAAAAEHDDEADAMDSVRDASFNANVTEYLEQENTGGQSARSRLSRVTASAHAVEQAFEGMRVRTHTSRVPARRCACIWRHWRSIRCARRLSSQSALCVSPPIPYGCDNAHWLQDLAEVRLREAAAEKKAWLESLDPRWRAKKEQRELHSLATFKEVRACTAAPARRRACTHSRLAALAASASDIGHSIQR